MIAPAESLPAARRPIAAAALVVLAGIATVLIAFGLAHNSLDATSVQAHELDVAGSQRRLVERIALDVARLELDPGDEVSRAELVRTASRLEQVHHGLLDGSLLLDLDGELPDEVRGYYAANGLDLGARLDAYVETAIDIASQAGLPDPALLARIEQESESQRLVSDLDVVVDAIARAADERVTSARRHLAVSMLLVSAGGLATLVLLAVVGRRASRFVRRSRDLSDQLLRSEDIYRTTVEALPDGLAILDDDFELVDLNSAGHRLMELHRGGAMTDEVTGRPLRLPFIDVNGRPVAEADRPSSRALRDGETVRNEILGIPTDQGTYWVRCTATPLQHPTEDRRYAILTFADVTEERRLAEHLAAEEARFRLAVQHAPIGIALVEADGTFVDVNQSLCDLVKRSRSELLGTTFHDITHPDDLAADEAHVQRLLAGEADSYRMEKRYLTPAGEIVDVLLAVAIVRRLGAGPYFIAEIVDLSDRKRAERAQQRAFEQQLELVDRLRELDVAKNQFVSTVSHELRTPLTSTIGYLELVIDGAAGPIGQKQREMLDIAHHQGFRLLALIEDLLFVAQLENREVTPHRRPVDARELVEAVAATIRPLAQQKGLHVGTRIESDAASTLGDAVQLERALLNIANNAVKFTPADGRVDLVASNGPDGSVLFSVRDTGIGIPIADQQRVFERFYRTQHAHVNATPGSGLGLAISAEIVELHGGRIEISSLEQVGTTVTITLPNGDDATTAESPLVGTREPG